MESKTTCPSKISLGSCILRLNLIGWLLACTILVSCNSGSGTSDISGEKIFYEVYLPHWGDQKALENVAKRIGHFQSLFVDGLIISPLQPVSERMKIGQLGSPFAIKDFNAFNSDMGTPEQFKSLVDSLHSLGISVYMDWFPAVAAYDNALVELEDTASVHSVFLNNENLSYKDVTLLNYNNPKVVDGMLEAMKHWKSEYNLDGFRIFHANHLPDDVLDDMEAIAGNLIAGIESEEKESIYDLRMDSRFYTAMQSASETSSPEPLKPLLLEAEGLEGSVHYTTTYIQQSRDGSPITVFGNRYKLAFALATFLDGNLFISGGQEIPIRRGLSLYLNRDITWPEKTEIDFYRELILLKKKNKALQPLSGIETTEINTNNDRIFGIKKVYKGHTVIGIFNLSGQSETAVFDEPIFNVNDYQQQRPIQIRGGDDVLLAPMQFLLFTNI